MMILQANFNQKKVGIAIFIPEKTDFEPKKRNKRQRRMVHNDKVDNSSKYITVINIYAHNIGVPDI